MERSFLFTHLRPQAQRGQPWLNLQDDFIKVRAVRRLSFDLQQAEGMPFGFVRFPDDGLPATLPITSIEVSIAFRLRSLSRRKRKN